jgi:hypothetical protein
VTSDALRRLRLDYAPLILRYLAHPDEKGLQSAYDVGREAMQRSVPLLDVIRVHNEASLAVQASAPDLDEALRVAAAASAMLVELVASFEMTQRGFMATRRQGAPQSPPG